MQIQDDAEAVIRTAIARKTCVRAVYNRVEVLLAPHHVFDRHGEPFLRAVTIEHGGRKPREAKLGTFKLSGLGAVEPTRKLFSPASVFAGLLDDAVSA